MDNSSLLFWCLYITSFFRRICYYPVVMSKNHLLFLIKDIRLNGRLMRSFSRPLCYIAVNFFCRITTRDGWHIMIIPPTHHARWDEAEKAFHVRKKVNTV